MHLSPTHSRGTWRLVLLGLAATLFFNSCALFRGWRDRPNRLGKPRVENLGDLRLEKDMVIRLEIFEGGSKKADEELTVDPEGNVAVSGVGPVSVEGMAPLQAARKIEFLARTPGQNHLSGSRVHLTEIDGRAVVHLSGMVRQSGVVTIRPDETTVAKAIEVSGGISALANPGAVSVTSLGRKTIVTSPGSRQLHPGDVVNVPRRLQ